MKNSENTKTKQDFFEKRQINPSAFVNPVPLVMVSCGTMDSSDIITIAWCGTVNSDPPMASVSIRKSRFSHGLISASGKAVINLVSSGLAGAADLCGVRSGADTDKFKIAGLKKVPSPIYGIPMIGDSPVNIECSVDRVIELGSHDLFLLNIEGVYVADKLFDENGKIDLRKADLVSYSHGEYYSLGKILGFYGYSVAGGEALSRRLRS